MTFIKDTFSELGFIICIFIVSLVLPEPYIKGPTSMCDVLLLPCWAC